MISSRKLSSRKSPSSAPATPRSCRTTNEATSEHRAPSIAAAADEEQQEAIVRKASRNESGKASPRTCLGPRLPAAPSSKQWAPASSSTTPASPVASSSLTVSPTRKESYKDLIVRAISTHPDKLMTLSDIYAWIVANIEIYRDQSHIPSTQGWKNAIRHTLSFYKCFKRVKRHPSIEKPSYWTIDYQEQQSPGGGSSRIVPPSPKPPSSPLVASSTTVIRSPGTIASVIRESLLVEDPNRTRPAAQEVVVGDTEAAVANGRPPLPPTFGHHTSPWSLGSSDTHASKEEQCIQGLLLFRTSAGFSFLPKSAGDYQPPRPPPTSSPAKPAAPEPSIPSERAAAYASSDISSVYGTGGASAPAPMYGASSIPRGGDVVTGSTAVGRTHLPTGSSVTVMVDTMAGAGHHHPPPTTCTWTGLPPTIEREGGVGTVSVSQIMEPELSGQRKQQIQKRYSDSAVQSSSTLSFEPASQQQSAASLNKQESVSYVQLIANAILESPQKRATLAQIYEWLVRNVSAFKGQEASPSSVGWKNAVRHTLSTRPFFKRIICEEAFGRQKPAWWTVDVHAMNLASTLRQQQQHSQLRVPRKRRNGQEPSMQEPSPVRSSSDTSAAAQSYHPTTSVIRRASGDVASSATTTFFAKSTTSEPSSAAAISGEEDVKWSSIIGLAGAVEKEAVSSPLDTSGGSVFRLPSLSVSSGGTTTSTVSTCQSDLVSPTVDIINAAGGGPYPSQTSDLVRGAAFESAVGLEMDVFECLLKHLMYSLQGSPGWSRVLFPREALIFTLVRLRRRTPTIDSPSSSYVRPSKAKDQLKRLYYRWLTFLASGMSDLIVWPSAGLGSSSDGSRPPGWLMDRLIVSERMDSPDRATGILDVFTMEVMYEQSDECCRRTINAALVYNFDGAVIYRSKLYWLGCRNHAPTFQSGLRSMVEDCVEKDLKGKLADADAGDRRTNGGGGKILLSYLKTEDILPREIYVVRSKIVRNLLREKLSDRLSRFDVLNTPIILRKKRSKAVAALTHLDDALTVCSALLNLSPPVARSYDDYNNGV